MAKWPNAELKALSREYSDHYPLFLKSLQVDFGPIPFKFFNSWITNGDLSTSVSRVWSLDLGSLHPAVSFKNKLKTLKFEIKKWRLFEKSKEISSLNDLRLKIDAIDQKAELGNIEMFDIENRATLMKDRKIFKSIRFCQMIIKLPWFLNNV